MTLDIDFRICPPVTNEAINALFAVSWADHQARDWVQVLGHSLAYVCAYQDTRLVGFANVAWDGGWHAFLLDPTVHPDLRHQGIGSELVRQASSAARDRGVVWLHVDYEITLEPFYRQCGFRHTEAGLMRLQADSPGPRGEHTVGQNSTVRLQATARTRTLSCRRCRRETTHTWRQWRPWYLFLHHRRWLEGWVCEQCAELKFVWRVRRGRRY